MQTPRPFPTFLAMPLLVAALFGCSANGAPAAEDETPNPPASATAEQGQSGTSPLPANTAKGGALEVAEENDVYSFDYSYPAEAGRIPGLKALLDQRMTKMRETHIAAAIDGRADADASGFPFNPYASSTEWAVVADLPDWLSLSAEHWEFMGGAHGNSTFDSLVWDKRAGTERDPLSLFVSQDALQKAVQPDFCNLLDKQRAEKRGEPVVRSEDDWMSECIGIDSATLILGSSNRRTFDRIGFLIPPYAAGPYVEGSYEVTLPVDAAILNAVKPEFRGSFSAVK